MSMDCDSDVTVVTDTTEGSELPQSPIFLHRLNMLQMKTPVRKNTAVFDTDPVCSPVIPTLVFNKADHRMTMECSQVPEEDEPSDGDSCCSRSILISNIESNRAYVDNNSMGTRQNDKEQFQYNTLDTTCQSSNKHVLKPNSQVTNGEIDEIQTSGQLHKDVNLPPELGDIVDTNEGIMANNVTEESYARTQGLTGSLDKDEKMDVSADYASRRNYVIGNNLACKIVTNENSSTPGIENLINECHFPKINSSDNLYDAGNHLKNISGFQTNSTIEDGSVAMIQECQAGSRTELTEQNTSDHGEKLTDNINNDVNNDVNNDINNDVNNDVNNDDASRLCIFNETAVSSPHPKSRCTEPVWPERKKSSNNQNKESPLIEPCTSPVLTKAMSSERETEQIEISPIASPQLEIRECPSGAVTVDKQTEQVDQSTPPLFTQVCPSTLSPNVGFENTSLTTKHSSPEVIPTVSSVECCLEKPQQLIENQNSDNLCTDRRGEHFGTDTLMERKSCGSNNIIRVDGLEIINEGHESGLFCVTNNTALNGNHRRDKTSADKSLTSSSGSAGSLQIDNELETLARQISDENRKKGTQSGRGATKERIHEQWRGEQNGVCTTSVAVNINASQVTSLSSTDEQKATPDSLAQVSEAVGQRHTAEMEMLNKIKNMQSSLEVELSDDCVNDVFLDNMKLKLAEIHPLLLTLSRSHKAEKLRIPVEMNKKLGKEEKRQLKRQLILLSERQKLLLELFRKHKEMNGFVNNLVSETLKKMEVDTHVRCNVAMITRKAGLKQAEDARVCEITATQNSCPNIVNAPTKTKIAPNKLNNKDKRTVGVDWKHKFENYIAVNNPMKRPATLMDGKLEATKRRKDGLTTLDSNDITVSQMTLKIPNPDQVRACSPSLFDDASTIVPSTRPASPNGSTMMPSTRPTSPDTVFSEPFPLKAIKRPNGPGMVSGIPSNPALKSLNIPGKSYGTTQMKSGVISSMSVNSVNVKFDSRQSGFQKPWSTIQFTSQESSGRGQKHSYVPPTRVVTAVNSRSQGPPLVSILHPMLPGSTAVPAAQPISKQIRELQTPPNKVAENEVQKMSLHVKMLESGIICPGENVLSVNTPTRVFRASLLASGVILGSGGEAFNNPTSWLRAINGGVPAKRAQAYNQVMYGGRSLSDWQNNVGSSALLITLENTCNKDHPQCISTPICDSAAVQGPAKNSLSAETTYLRELLSNCRIRLIQDNEIIHVDKETDHCLWSKEFYNSCISSNLLNSIDAW